MRLSMLAFFASCTAANPSATPRAEHGDTPVVPRDAAVTLGAIEGFVYNATTGAPLPDAFVAIDRSSVRTDARGAWKLTGLLPGPYTLDILALSGAAALDVSIDPGRTTHFDVRLDEAHMRELERAATPVQMTKAECTPSAIETRLGAKPNELVDCGVISTYTTDAGYAKARVCISGALATHRPFRFADDLYGFGLVSLPDNGGSYEITVFDNSDVGDRTIHGVIRQCRPLVARRYPPADCASFEVECVTCEAMTEVPGCKVPF